MNITTKIIITDTNIVTDLNNAHILDQFIKLDNVYISDIVKNDEINEKTGTITLINDFKVMTATDTQLIEASKLNIENPKLSLYDLLNFILARDNNCILATGDNNLKKYSQKNGIEVIRTLRIIKLMKDKNIISNSMAINACNLLKECPSTRIPIIDIDNLINELKKIQ